MISFDFVFCFFCLILNLTLFNIVSGDNDRFFSGYYSQYPLYSYSSSMHVQPTNQFVFESNPYPIAYWLRHSSSPSNWVDLPDYDPTGELLAFGLRSAVHAQVAVRQQMNQNPNLMSWTFDWSNELFPSSFKR